ncbi:hypothetical protein [Ensifer sp. BR816]|uniref:hypothetical protein n=1 Tax=Rhizobium sp. (strain BR816) TaxID=1057002 RepID=UPI00039DC00E|nr:hypothetical protein [Ensifer sp. BR816]
MGPVPTLLTLLTAVVLLLQMDLISYVAGAAAKGLAEVDLLGMRRSLVVHAAGGIFVLLMTTVLSIYKPRGLTRYGWRKQQSQIRERP